ncbi:protein phosphatase CheZ [Rhodospirillum rubrum]|uniref:Uncharacterized protein n=1 Tax=Rhodospirillum rubrum (strain ATCC 11170 / ATH 1.1.1 / DSM 467 / LMG 4362 / NCIMB 8255 / S1) TaxID=269796 RepID=Q2RQG2_RHORT|nr:protein phosphatase CheZ [Rhodospirillum rubrum]ABC23633.1 conserved hypothetical protein [Rhodospirillum rubrum ATCC 11170]AEO49371.1 hypothetical protein F11_14545 [Rhodospirillum rubrum F11]MBK5955309.1 hypothetical protein [Rhodospirillum rubrum]QXG79593.1 protein phosphatase CheZ [Rhodospirillum rubrum]HAP98648.1 hypothetical protein [Rhodospirillum rubrum]
MPIDTTLRGALDRALAHLRSQDGADDLAALLESLRDGLSAEGMAPAGAPPLSPVPVMAPAGVGPAVDGPVPRPGAHPDDRVALIEEIRALSTFIETARNDLAVLRPRDIQERFIPTASDELDAIVQSTETATQDIMDAVEGLEALEGRLEGEDARALALATTRIYEACTFQDITGQRITKVVRTLKSIEERVDALLSTFAPDGLLGDGAPGSADDPARFRQTAAAVGDRPEDMALLNGPGSPGAVMNQDDIDALLKDFD